jgi:glycosyltransferase involved in cell wall biosynthesis
MVEQGSGPVSQRENLKPGPPEAGPAKKRTIIFLVTEDWYFWTHRLPVAHAARQAGFEVIVAARTTAHAERIRGEGFQVRPLAWRRKGDGPLVAVRALAAIYRIYRVERPTLVHHVALKAIVFGSIAAFFARVPHQVNAVAGLGFAFTETSPKTLALRTAILLVLRLFVRRPNSYVIVQNSSDGEYLTRRGVLRPSQVVTIRGSGVDVARFAPTAEPTGRIVVTTVSRMLRHKGLEVLVKAANLLRKRGMDLRFLLVGPIDAESPASLTEGELRAWARTDVVEWLGPCDDIPEIWAQSHIAAFPSFYREGIPLALLEAAACGKPIVCTNIPGCREVVEHEVSGLLVPENDPAAFAQAVELLARDQQLRCRMGEEGRRRAERFFTKEIVAEQTMVLYRGMLGESCSV